MIFFCSIYPGWVFAHNLTPDLAIIELRQRVNFVPNMIGPICVPPLTKFDDKPEYGYAGGWGANQFSCDTNDNGPNPHTKCKFPFKYKGQTYTKCTKIVTPSADNPICLQLYKWTNGKRKHEFRSYSLRSL